jgi:flagellar protein FlaH
VHSHGLNPDLLIRLRSLCDAHLQLRTEEVGQKLVKTLEVTKVRGADKSTGNIISFEVEPGWGMRIIPINKVNG